MAEGSAESRSDTRASQDPGHPDAAGGTDAPEHDREGRAPDSPYVPPGRDEQGNPQPSVPHEGLLGRIAVGLVAGQSVVLAVVAIAGYIVSSGGFTSQADTSFLALRLNPAHSTLLAVTVVLGVVALFRRRWLRIFALVQAVVYLLLFVFGSAFSVNTASSTFLDLNTPDHILHAVLALLGFITLYITSARIVEPPPGPLPYPEITEGTDRSGDGSGADDRPRDVHPGR